MLIENGKLSNLLSAVNSIKKMPGLPYTTIFNFAKVIKFGEESLKPFYSTLEEIRKEHPQKKDEEGKPMFVTAPNGQQKAVFEDEDGLQKKGNELALAKVDFIMDKFEINYAKTDTRLNVEIMKIFMDAFGDNFIVTEI